MLEVDVEYLKEPKKKYDKLPYSGKRIELGKV